MNDPNTLIAFSVSDAAIATLAAEYLPLKIIDINDAAGFKRVHDARMVVKDKRVLVEKTRKELKADALEFGRKVDAEAKRLTALLTPIEEHLDSEESRIQAEKDAIKNAARLKAEAEAKAKAEAERAAFLAEQQRQAEERRKLDAERELIEAEKRKLAEEAAARQREIEAEARRKAEAEEAERRKAAEAEAAKRRAEELEKARVEAAERARVETEQRIAREAEEKAAKEKALAEAAAEKARKAEARRLRQEALRPDREKLERFAEIVNSLDVPTLTTAKVAAAVATVLAGAAGKIREIAAGLE